MQCYNRWGLRHLVWFVVSSDGNLRYYGLILVLGPLGDPLVCNPTAFVSAIPS
eukprot:COSAG02_NODE_67476_length_253_cov_0.519481_1_plen_52_part_01